MYFMIFVRFDIYCINCILKHHGVSNLTTYGYAVLMNLVYFEGRIEAQDNLNRLNTYMKFENKILIDLMSKD